MKAFMISLVGFVFAGIALRADVFVIGYFLILTGVAAGLVGRGRSGVAGTVGGNLLGWVVLVAADLWGTVTTIMNVRSWDAETIGILPPVLVIMLVGEMAGYAAGATVMRLARDRGPRLPGLFVT